MKAKSLTSRADLVRWLVHCKQIKAEQWQEETAALLGYEWQLKQNETLPESLPSPTTKSKKEAQNKHFVENKTRPAERFYYLAYREAYASESDAAINDGIPSALQDIAALSDDDLISKEQGNPFPFQPLLNAQRLTPFIAKQLRHQQGETLDLPRLIQQLAEYKPLKTLPTTPRLLPAGNVTVFIDLSERLLPFWQDIPYVCEVLKKTHGKLGLDMRVLVNDNPMDAYIAYSDWLKNRLKRRSWQAIAPQSEVFIISDLGQLLPQQQHLKQHWLHLLQHLYKRSIVPTVLAPIGTVHQCSRIQALSQQVLWQKQSRLVPQKASAYYHEHQQKVARVLGFLSLSPHIEPPLLRAILALLPVTEAHSGIEADVYLHADMQWGYRVITMRANKREHYQQLFAKESSALQKAVLQCIKQHHQGQFPAVWYETVLNAEPLGFDLASIADIEQAELFMQRFAKRTLKQKQHKGIMQYAARYLNRLSSQQRKHYSKAFTSTLYGVSHRHDLLAGGVIPEEYDAEIVQQVLQEAGERKTAYLLQIGWQLYLSQQPPESISNNGFACGHVLAELTTSQNTVRVERQMLTLNPQTPIPLSWEKAQHSLTLFTGQEELIIASLSKPSWARSLSYQDGELVATLVMAGTEYRCLPFYERITGSDGNKDVQRWQVIQESEQGIGFDEYGLYFDLVIGGITQRFRWIEPTTFMMGSPEDEAGRYDGYETQHPVTLTQGYWLADTTVTQALWQAVMGENPSYFTAEKTGLSTTDNHPVEQISWDDCQRFIASVNQKFPPLNARLPTEAEWENACRTGTTGAFSFAGDLEVSKVNYSGRWTLEEYKEKGFVKEALQQTATVKSYPSNAWGLYEMHGNVLEWCSDFWQKNLGQEPVTDPDGAEGAEEGSRRVLRGGSWYDNGRYVRSALRNDRAPVNRNNDFGVRLALGHPSYSQHNRASMVEQPPPQGGQARAAAATVSTEAVDAELDKKTRAGKIHDLFTNKDQG